MGDTILIETTADEVVSIVTAGPQGPSGSEAATLTTTGDLLYRAALANDRLGIGSEGQVLKVASGLPVWSDESGAVTSVNGETGAVTLNAADVGAAPSTGIDPTAITGTAVVDSDARLSDSRTPTTHAASHAAAGSDPLAPSDIGAQSLFTQLLLSTPTDATPYALSATRAVSIRVFTTTDYTVRLPESGHLTGDIVEIRADTLSATKTLTIEKGVGSTAWSGIATITSQGGKRRFVATGTGRGNWLEDFYFTTNGNLGAPASHTHTATDITSGTLAHERGGLEADVSAYSGLVKIDAGSTSAVTVTAAGEALLDDADASAQRTTLGLGNSATLNTGTTAGTVAEGNHTHELANLDATGATDGHVLTADGAGGAAWEAASGGVSAVGASAADILSVSGSDLVADDPNADRLVFYDDSASKLTHLSLGSNALSIDGTTLKIQPLFPVGPISRGATYIPYIGSSANGGSSAVANIAGGYVLFSPVYVRASANYTTFSIIVTVAGSASSVGKMALYTIKPADATPETLVCQSGTFTTDSTGIKQPTMSSTFVSEGWYYMAIATNSTANVNFWGDTMALLRGAFSGAALGTASLLLDYSQKLYADLWPNPWDGTGTTFRNTYHPITSLT